MIRLYFAYILAEVDFFRQFGKEMKWKSEPCLPTTELHSFSSVSFLWEQCLNEVTQTIAIDEFYIYAFGIRVI